MPGKLQLFQARGKLNRRLGDEAHPFSRRSSGPRGPCARHDVAMRREEQRGRRGGRWTCSTARAWSEGARFRLTRKSHKYLSMHVDPRGITQNFQTTNAFQQVQQVLRRAHEARPDSAAFTVRLPRDDLARYVRVPHPARPHASRTRGAARSTGHWLERVCFKSRTKSKRIFFVRPQFAFPRPERTRPRAPSPWVIRRFSRAR
jgi:hypothetical protein